MYLVRYFSYKISYTYNAYHSINSDGWLNKIILKPSYNSTPVSILPIYSFGHYD